MRLDCRCTTVVDIGGLILSDRTKFSGRCVTHSRYMDSPKLWCDVLVELGNKIIVLVADALAAGFCGVDRHVGINVLEVGGVLLLSYGALAGAKRVAEYLDGLVSFCLYFADMWRSLGKHVQAN